MNELHRYRSFADTRSDALHRTMPHITHRKYSRNICFEQEWIPVERPPLGVLPVTDKIGASQEEAALVALDEISQPVSSWQGSNKDEDRIRRYPLHLAGIRTQHRNLFQARVTMHLHHAGVSPHLNIGRLFNLID